MIPQLQITPHLESCLVLPPPLVDAVPVVVLFIVLVALLVVVLVHLFLVVIVLLSPPRCPQQSRASYTRLFEYIVSEGKNESGSSIYNCKNTRKVYAL